MSFGSVTVMNEHPSQHRLSSHTTRCAFSIGDLFILSLFRLHDVTMALQRGEGAVLDFGLCVCVGQGRRYWDIILRDWLAEHTRIHTPHTRLSVEVGGQEIGCRLRNGGVP